MTRLLKSVVIGIVLSVTPNLFSTIVLSADPLLTETTVGNPQARRRSSAQRKPRVDYSRFSHGTHLTGKGLACDSCHKFPTKNWKEVRKGDAAFPDVAEFPEHATCLNCHRQQFFARERPAPAICSNCHVKVTPRDTARFLFPSLGDVSGSQKLKPDSVSEFAIGFPHDKHLDAVSLNSPAQTPRPSFVKVAWQDKAGPAESTEAKSCPVCHQTYKPQGDSAEEYVTKPPPNLNDAFWLKKGSFKTIPNSHTTCFTCHNADMGIAPLPSDCHVCHKLRSAQQARVADFDSKLAEQMGADLTMLRAWRRRASSGTFRHEGGEHPNLSGLSCHHVASMNTTEPLTLKVGVKSCGGAEGCHVTATTDDGGALNYEIDQKKAGASFVCTKCHITFGKSGVPGTHVNVINLLKKS